MVQNESKYSVIENAYINIWWKKIVLYRYFCYPIFSTIIMKSIVNSLVLCLNTRVSSNFPETTLKVKGWKYIAPNDNDRPNKKIVIVKPIN